MIITKNPAIEALDHESLCHSIYTELYSQFFNAQQRKDEQHPHGVEEGDEISIRLHNSAYGFAFAIAGAVEGNGQGDQSGILLDYLKKAGGDMSGYFRANYGFEGGIDNKKLLDFYNHGETEGVRLTQDIDIYGSLYMSGKKIAAYYLQKNKLDVSAGTIDLGISSINSRGEMLFGDSKEKGVYIAGADLRINNHEVYHKGNANLTTVDWRMQNGIVSGSLSVEGTVTLSGPLNALNGVKLGNDGQTYVSFHRKTILANCDLSFAPDYGVKIDEKLVLGRTSGNDISLAGIGGNLILGSQDTNKINLITGITDQNGDYILISPYGAAYFPDSLTVRHNFGNTLFSSYRNNPDDEGMVIHKRLRLGAETGPWIEQSENGLKLTGQVEYIDSQNNSRTTKPASFSVKFASASGSFIPTDRNTQMVVLSTDSEQFYIDRPAEVFSRLGIHGSATRLEAGTLYLNDERFLLAVNDGIKHYGNTYILGDLASEFFSSGFAGSGWAIQKNMSTGNTTATFDEITVRKKMRVYEMEIKKTTATNGALWVSDSFSGDTVQQIT